MQVGIIRREYGTHRLLNDLLFVICRNNDSDGRFEVRPGKDRDFTQAVIGGQHADAEQASTHENVTQQEHPLDDEDQDVQHGERCIIQPGSQNFIGNELEHDVCTGLAHEFFHGNNLETVGAQTFNDLWQCLDSGFAVSAAIVKKNDVSADRRLVRLAGVGRVPLRLVHYGGDYVLHRAATLPVIRIYFGTDGDESHALYVVDGTDLIGDVRFLVNRVRRPEEERLYSQFAGKEPFRDVQFKINIALRYFTDARMSEGVIANCVPFIIDTPGQPGKFLHFKTDEKKSCGRLFLLKDIKDSRRVRGIRAIIKGDGDFLVFVAVLAELIRLRQRSHCFRGNQTGVRIKCDIALAGLGLLAHVEDVSETFSVNVFPGRNVPEFLFGIGFTGRIPDGPQ